MPDGPFLRLFIAFIVLFGGLLIFTAINDVRLMNQCKADGQPEYVCHSYVYRGRR